MVWEETIIFLPDETKMVSPAAHRVWDPSPASCSSGWWAVRGGPCLQCSPGGLLNHLTGPFHVFPSTRTQPHLWPRTSTCLTLFPFQVFLSATLSNASEFAAWVAHLHKQPCHVVYTDYRPTPLQHYAYPLGGKGMHLILDERGNFR